MSTRRGPPSRRASPAPSGHGQQGSREPSPGAARSTRPLDPSFASGSQLPPLSHSRSDGFLSARARRAGESWPQLPSLRTETSGPSSSHRASPYPSSSSRPGEPLPRLPPSSSLQGISGHPSSGVRRDAGASQEAGPSQPPAWLLEPPPPSRTRGSRTPRSGRRSRSPAPSQPHQRSRSTSRRQPDQAADPAARSPASPARSTRSSRGRRSTDRRSPATPGPSDPYERWRPSRSGPTAAELDQRRYRLELIQTPVSGCAFGTNLLGRLPLAPPLIVQLKIEAADGTPVEGDDELPFLVAHVALETDTGQAVDMLSPANSPQRPGGSSQQAAPQLPTQPVRMLYGTLVSSAAQIVDPQGRQGTFFCFPEISVRARGDFRLRVLLMRVPIGPMAGSNSSVLAEVATEPFPVVLSPDYVAPAVTDITRIFARQGMGLLLPASYAQQTSG